MKTCKDCGIEKPLSDYYIQSYRKKDGVPSYFIRCKKCHSKFTTLVKKSPKKPKKPKPINPYRAEVLKYIKLVIARNYMISEVDFFRILHYHQLIFNRDNDLYSAPYKLIYYNWKELERWYIKES